jgi:hypothetical protein
VIAFFRAMLARVDSSLIEEWESLVQPGETKPEFAEAVPDRAPRRLDRRSFDARVRAEMHQFMQALSRLDYESAAGCLLADGEDEWEAPRLEAEWAPFFETQPTLRCDPEARLAHWTRIEARGEFSFEVVQTLVDPEGEGASQIEAEVELTEARMPPGPMLRFVRLRP